MYELIADGIVGVIAGVAAWKAKKANDHVSPNGTGKSLTTLLEEISDKAERAAQIRDELLEWQVDHELHHSRMARKFVPMLEELLVRMEDHKESMGEHRDATEDDR